MHPHMAEIVAKAWLHVRARRCVERLAGRAQHVMHDRRRYAIGWAGSRALERIFALLSTLLALASTSRMLPAGTGALEQAADRRRHCWCRFNLMSQLLH